MPIIFKNSVAPGLLGQGREKKEFRKNMAYRGKIVENKRGTGNRYRKGGMKIRFRRKKRRKNSGERRKKSWVC